MSHVITVNIIDYGSKFHQVLSYQPTIFPYVRNIRRTDGVIYATIFPTCSPCLHW